MSTDPAVMQREFLWGLWKVHILSEASRRPVVGMWILQDLRKRGYDVSPGALYPVLRRMVEHGWLACPDDPKRGAHARKEYALTEAGREVLAELRAEVARLHDALNA